MIPSWVLDGHLAVVTRFDAWGCLIFAGKEDGPSLGLEFNNHLGPARLITLGIKRPAKYIFLTYSNFKKNRKVKSLSLKFVFLSFLGGLLYTQFRNLGFLIW